MQTSPNPLALGASKGRKVNIRLLHILIIPALGLGWVACDKAEKIVNLYCDSQADCKDPTRPLCFVDFHTCYSPDMGPPQRPCTKETEVQKCKDTQPVCGDDKICRGCTAHGECVSQVCNPDGSCALASDIVFVDNKNGSCTGTHAGTKEDPACQISDGIAKAQASNKPLVKVAGSTDSYAAVALNATISDIGPITVLGPGKAAVPAAKIFHEGSSALSLITAGKSITLTVDGIEFTGAKTSLPKTSAVLCSQNTGTATLTIKNSSVHDASDVGIKLTDCTIVIQQSEVQGNQGAGISTSGGSVTIQQSEVQGNQGAGISTSGGSVTIQQSEVQGNVAGGIMLGSGTMYNVINSMINLNMSQGVSIDKTATGIFAFNTVAMNTAAAGAGGIDCGTTVNKIIQNSIVWGNTLDSGSQLGTKCMVETVVTGPTDNKGTVKTPAFVGATDFHLKLNDPANTDCCVDKIFSGPDVDFDGTKRPQGASWDIGAHELGR